MNPSPPQTHDLTPEQRDMLGLARRLHAEGGQPLAVHAIAQRGRKTVEALRRIGPDTERLKDFGLWPWPDFTREPPYPGRTPGAASHLVAPLRECNNGAAVGE